MKIGEGLRLDALCCVDQKHRPFDGRKRARNLVAEVAVPGRVDEVQDEPLAGGRRVFHAHRRHLDGDAALALELHLVEILRLHAPRLDGFCGLKQPVGKGRLSVVDVGDYYKVTDILHCRASIPYPTPLIKSS